MILICFSAVSKESDLKVLEGVIEIGSQYHFYMETLACIVKPIEDGQVSFGYQIPDYFVYRG
jgi:xanthine dehydrogenase molybdopterin-binding subunit B